MNETVVLCEQCDRILMPEDATANMLNANGNLIWFCSGMCCEIYEEELINVHK